MTAKLVVPSRIATLVLLLVLLAGCGGGGGEPASESEGATTAPPAEVSPEALAESLEGAAAGFVVRPGTTLANSLDQLGRGTSATVDAGSAECRRGGQTPAIGSNRRFPFACIVGISAEPPGGPSVSLTLGFIVLGVEGRCWKAANERIAAEAGRPVLIPKQAALDPENRLEGCL